MEQNSTSSKAYEDGYADGLAWDLDGFADRAAVERESDGWSEATINAVGSEECEKAWGVTAYGPDGLSTDEWESACEDYDRGAHAGALAPQAERTGCGPRSEEVAS